MSLSDCFPFAVWRERSVCVGTYWTVWFSQRSPGSRSDPLPTLPAHSGGQEAQSELMPCNTLLPGFLNNKLPSWLCEAFFSFSISSKFSNRDVIKTQGDTLNESVKTHAGVDCSLYPGSAILLDYIYTVCVLHWNETHWQELIFYYHWYVICKEI